MGEIENIVIKTLERTGKIEKGKLIKLLNIHPGVIEYVLRKMKKEGKIKLEKIKRPHKPKKYEIYIEI